MNNEKYIHVHWIFYPKKYSSSWVNKILNGKNSKTYQIDVNFRVSSGTTASITSHNPFLHRCRGCLCDEVNRKLLVDLLGRLFKSGKSVVAAVPLLSKTSNLTMKISARWVSVEQLAWPVCVGISFEEDDAVLRATRRVLEHLFRLWRELAKTLMFFKAAMTVLGSCLFFFFSKQLLSAESCSPIGYSADNTWTFFNVEWR